jgi:mono/diheme cytochrome c family protein
MRTRGWLAIFMASLGLAVAGCKHEKPNTVFMPDMAYGPALKAQEDGAMRMPVRGTVPRDFQAYPYRQLVDAERELSNPLQPTRQVLERGKVVFDNYCRVCHGPEAEGNGTIQPMAGRTLHSDKVRNLRDGGIFHIITMGQNLMPSYATQIDPGDRWAAVWYVRALQRAKNPTPEDLRAATEQ